MKQLTTEQLQKIKAVHEAINKVGVYSPQDLNEVYKLINTQNSIIHTKAVKLITLNRFMTFNYHQQLKAAEKIEALDNLFTCADEEEKVSLVTDVPQTTTEEIKEVVETIEKKRKPRTNFKIEKSK